MQYYEDRIKAFGGIELILGGISENGYAAFNDPGKHCRSSRHHADLHPHTAGSFLAVRTLVKTPAFNTILVNARFFNNGINAVTTMALTIGMGTVLDNREVIVIVAACGRASR